MKINRGIVVDSYSIDHESIILTSTNRDAIEHYESYFANITELDIKSNKVKNRHNLLVTVGLLGDFPLFEQYMSARDYFQTAYGIEVEKLPKYNRQLNLKIAKETAKQITEQETGWVI